MLKSLYHSSMSRRAERADKKRRVIIKAAKKVFLKNGFGGATMDAVAIAGGVSKMTVYRHFEDKEALFAGVITALCENVVDDNVDKLFKGEPAQALRRFGRKMASILFAPETVELHRIVIAESRRFPKLGEFFYKSGPETSISTLAGYFQRNKNHPALKISDPRRCAEEFLELLRGYSHLRMLLGLQKKASPREISSRIEIAISFVLSKSE